LLTLTAKEAVLALVDFPKQIVVALCVAVKYMKSVFVPLPRLIFSIQIGGRFQTSIIFRKGNG